MSSCAHLAFRSCLHQWQHRMIATMSTAPAITAPMSPAREGGSQFGDISRSARRTDDGTENAIQTAWLPRFVKQQEQRARAPQAAQSSQDRAIECAAR